MGTPYIDPAVQDRVRKHTEMLMQNAGVPVNPMTLPGALPPAVVLPPAPPVLATPGAGIPTPQTTPAPASGGGQGAGGQGQEAPEPPKPPPPFKPADHIALGQLNAIPDYIARFLVDLSRKTLNIPEGGGVPEPEPVVPEALPISPEGPTMLPPVPMRIGGRVDPWGDTTAGLSPFVTPMKRESPFSIRQAVKNYDRWMASEGLGSPAALDAWYRNPEYGTPTDLAIGRNQGSYNPGATFKQETTTTVPKSDSDYVRAALPSSERQTDFAQPSDVTDLELMADGGYAAVQPYIVGERGPELFIPDRPGYIVPNEKLAPPIHRANGGDASPVPERFQDNALTRLIFDTGIAPKAAPRQEMPALQPYISNWPTRAESASGVFRPPMPNAPSGPVASFPVAPVTWGTAGEVLPRNSRSSTLPAAVVATPSRASRAATPAKPEMLYDATAGQYYPANWNVDVIRGTPYSGAWVNTPKVMPKMQTVYSETPQQIITGYDKVRVETENGAREELKPVYSTIMTRTPHQVQVGYETINERSYNPALPGGSHMIANAAGELPAVPWQKAWGMGEFSPQAIAQRISEQGALERAKTQESGAMERTKYTVDNAVKETGIQRAIRSAQEAAVNKITNVYDPKVFAKMMLGYEALGEVPAGTYDKLMAVSKPREADVRADLKLHGMTDEVIEAYITRARAMGKL